MRKGSSDIRERISDAIAEIKNALVLPNVILHLLVKGKKPSKKLAKMSVDSMDRVVSLLNQIKRMLGFDVR